MRMQATRTFTYSGQVIVAFASFEAQDRDVTRLQRDGKAIPLGMPAAPLSNEVGPKETKPTGPEETKADEPPQEE